MSLGHDQRRHSHIECHPSPYLAGDLPSSLSCYSETLAAGEGQIRNFFLARRHPQTAFPTVIRFAQKSKLELSTIKTLTVPILVNNRPSPLAQSLIAPAVVFAAERPPVDGSRPFVAPQRSFPREIFRSSTGPDQQLPGTDKLTACHDVHTLRIGVNRSTGASTVIARSCASSDTLTAYHSQPEQTDSTMEQNPSGSGQQQQRQQPIYDISNGGHYGASAALSAQGHNPVPELYQGTWTNVNQGLHGTYRDILTTYWQQTINHLENDTHDYKLHQLPLARIKKVMKADPEVKMISAEAPILFAKGCDIFITELTMRAWIHAEENKRRTLQRSDIASALAKSDMFDFLIDIVPREEATGHAKRSGGQAGAGAGGAGASSSSATGQLPPPNVQQQPHPGQQQPQPHPMAPPEYSLGHHPSLQQEQGYRTEPPMYPQVQPDPTSAYGQAQQPIFEGMYNYPPMGPQQMYQVSQRGQNPAGAHDPGHHFQRHDGGEGDADAEGERDYEVG
ncbi:hypothetical protein MMC20_006770 [Loxospora ochrophaea]|nr:hypothetical protein [Loxospora ochrophaea]